MPSLHCLFSAGGNASMVVGVTVTVMLLLVGTAMLILLAYKKGLLRSDEIHCFLKGEGTAFSSMTSIHKDLLFYWLKKPIIQSKFCIALLSLSLAKSERLLFLWEEKWWTKNPVLMHSQLSKNGILSIPTISVRSGKERWAALKTFSVWDRLAMLPGRSVLGSTLFLHGSTYSSSSTSNCPLMACFCKMNYKKPFLSNLG